VSAADALAKIRHYEDVTGTEVDFVRPFANPGLVALWVLDYNTATGTAARPLDGAA